jgi:thioredoxin-related protein
MDREVLADKEISSVLRNNTVYLRIDVEIRSDLAEFYSVRGYPTTSFLEPSGQRITQVPGYISKKEFAKLLVYVTGKHYKTTRLRDFLRK